LVIAALLPEHEMLMVESRPRRCAWLEHACAEMGLTKAKVIAARLELVPTVSASVISARAFAPLDKLIALSARFSTATTRWLLPKGRQAAQELQALQGWQHAFHVEQSLTGGESGIIVGELAGPTHALRANGRKRGIKP
jgi:16S rRNA (guanine527-N7)-methyltransferase